jgi:hypothetical protein
MMKRNASNGGAREPHQIRMRQNRTQPPHEVLPQPWRALVATATLALLASPLVGCELVLGMSGHDAQQQPADTGTADAPGDTATDAPPAVCALPTTGDSAARVTNVVPATGKLDFCFKPDTGATIGPIFATALGCGGGLLYKESSASFPLPAGSYEIDVIKGGGKCSDKPIASVSHVTFDTGATSNAIVMGDGATDFTVKVLREAKPTTISSKIRFVHSLDGAPNQDFGLTDKTVLPATIKNQFFKNVAFGTTAPAGSGSGAGTIDANGYIDFNGSGAVLSLGRAPTGTTDLADLLSAKLVSSIGYTVYAVGRTDATGKSNDVKFPPELLLCNERDHDGVYARCANALPIDVAFDVVNTQLNGAWAQIEATRRPQLAAAISGLNGDVACVTEVWSESDKDLIVNGTKSKYPYNARTKADNSTPIDDATDQFGAVPPAPTTAACTGGDAPQLEALLTCMTNKCAVKKGDSSSTIIDLPSDCISTNCLAEVIATTGTPRCWDCALTHFFGRASFDATKTACETDPTARYSFGGTNGVVLLSRFPFDGTPEFINLGTTDFRVALVRAPIVVQDSPKTVVDAYCTVLTTPASGVTRPYVGPYGISGRTCTGDMDCDASLAESCDTVKKLCIPQNDGQWRNELLLQVTKVANQVATRSGAIKRRAVVMGDWYTGPKVGSLTDLNVESFNALNARLPLASADGFTPTCTYCADNPILTPPGTTPTGTSTWSTYSVLSNVAATDVRSNQVILKDATVTVAGQSYKVPVSPYYGFRSVVRIRP